MAVFGNGIMIIVGGYVIYFSIAFRARVGDPPNTIGRQIHDSPKLEFWWTVLPTLLLIVLTALSINVWYKIQFGVASPGLTAEVIGHQFYFEYRYPGLKTSVFSKTEAMHLPLGMPVRILITSADVIHQWGSPKFGSKWPPCRVWCRTSTSRRSEPERTRSPAPSFVARTIASCRAS